MVIKYFIPLSSPMATLSPLLQKGESKGWVRKALHLAKGKQEIGAVKPSFTLYKKRNQESWVRYTFTYPPPPLSRSLPLKHKGEAKGLV